MCIRIPCGYSFQTLSTLLAHFEIFLASVSLVAIGAFGTIALTSPSTLTNESNSDPGLIEVELFLGLNAPIQAAILIVFILYFTCGISLGILLLSGSQRRQLKKLKVWFLVQSICYFIRLLFFIGWLLYTNPNRRADVALCSILINLYAAFSLITVKYFVDEVKVENFYFREKGYC